MMLSTSTRSAIEPWKKGTSSGTTDAKVVDDAVDQHALGNRTLEEGHVVGHHVTRAVRQIVDDGDAPSRILERKDGMAADVAGTAGNEDGKLAHRSALAEARLALKACTAAPSNGA